MKRMKPKIPKGPVCKDWTGRVLTKEEVDALAEERQHARKELKRRVAAALAAHAQAKLWAMGRAPWPDPKGYDASGTAYYHTPDGADTGKGNGVGGNKVKVKKGKVDHADG